MESFLKITTFVEIELFVGKLKSKTTITSPIPEQRILWVISQNSQTKTKLENFVSEIHSPGNTTRDINIEWPQCKQLSHQGHQNYRTCLLYNSGCRAQEQCP